MNLLFIASDNNYTSGAFLSMIKLSELLCKNFEVFPFVILPNHGDGEELLNSIAIPNEVVPSRNWIVDIEDGRTEQREYEKEKELESNESAIARICEIVREKDIDLIHINTSYSYVGAVAAERCGIPFVWHIREFLEEDQNRKIWNRAKGYELMSQADSVIAISKSIYNKYAEILPKEKLKIIYNGIDQGQFFLPEKKLFVQENVQLSIIGGVVPHKGQAEAIKACGFLKRSGIMNFRLNIVGRIRVEYKEYLDQVIAENKLEEYVIFTGPQRDVTNVLRNTDILLVCSRNEAFGRTTVEGMMAGCVVIGADTAGTREILGEGKYGCLYKQGDEKDLADSVIDIISNPKEALEISKAGQKEALRNYTAAKNAANIYALYQEILLREKKEHG